MKKICYIPLDDRPVCKKRVELLGKASGFEVITPGEELIRTVLDNQPLTKFNLTCGSIDEIKKWFFTLNHNEIDAYIISLDQILSGGLVNSRTFDNVNIDLSINLINEYLEKINNKPIILIDSIVRLACTAGYKGYGHDEYHNFRNYAMHNRVVLDLPYSKEDIIDNYEKDKNNSFIDYNQYSLTRNMVDDYLNTRKRKLCITDYIISKLKNINNIYYMIGIDDSNPSNTIQSNEINYLRNRIEENNLKNKAIVFTGIDELGLMAFSRLSKFYYNKEEFKINLHYIGGMENIPGDTYDNGTIKEGVNYHLVAMDLDNTQTNGEANIDVVMLTYKEDEDGSQNSTVKEAIDLIENLLNKNKYVIVMDFSSWTKYGKLEEALIKKGRLTELLAYSNWNTIANITGIALSQGISRYFYIKNNQSDLEASSAYAELMAFSYLKDITYKIFACKEIKKDINKISSDEYLNFYNDFNKINIDSITKKYMDEEEHNVAASSKIINILLNGKFISSCNSNIKYNKIDYINILNYSYPWYRTFEMDINLELHVSEIEEKN